MKWIVAVLALLASAPVEAQTFPERGRAAVVDAAHVIPDDQERQLNDRIAVWVAANGPQLAVVTVPSLEGRDVADYTNRLFRKWGLGSKEGDNGVLLLLAPNERRVRIEVGYGLEEYLTDAQTGRIIRETTVPKLKAGDVPGALSETADAIMAAATPPDAVEEVAVAPQPPTQKTSWLLLLGGFLMAGTPLALIVRSRRRERQRREQQEAREREERRQREREMRRTTEGPDVRTPLHRGFVVNDVPPGRVVPPFKVDPVRHTRPAPAYAPPPPPPPSRSDDSWSRSSSYDSGSSYSSPSYDSGSSSSGYDSGGGSSGGGGSDSSY